MNLTKQTIIDGVYGLAVGDALGVPFEFKSGKQMIASPCYDMRGGGTYGLPAGTWSDDTSLTLATMSGLCDSKSVDYECIIERFCAWYEKGENTIDGLFDIGNATRQALMRWLQGYALPWECGGRGELDNGNGSLMRILPAVLYSFAVNSGDVDYKFIGRMSALTHGTKLCRAACYIYAEVCAMVLRLREEGKPLTALLEDIDRIVKMVEGHLRYSGGEFNRIKEKSLFSLSPTDTDENFKPYIKSTGYVVHTLESALWCLLNSNSFEECALHAVNLGYDTDTTAAVACSLAGLYYGYEGIPEKWLQTLRGKDIIASRIDSFAKKLSKEGNYYFGNLKQDIERAEDGNVELMLDIANHFRGTRRYAEAFRFFMMAADSGNVEGEIAVSSFYQNGLIVERSNADAAKWLEKAAEKGSASAACELASYYSFERAGLEQDDKKREHWLNRAAELGSDEAMLTLGSDAYDSGDYDKALYWFTEATKKGNRIAHYELGMMYKNGVGVPIHLDTALKHLKKSAEKCWHKAQLELGKWYFEEQENTKKNTQKALYWLRRAAVQCNPYAQLHLAIVYLTRFSHERDMTAMFWLVNSANQGCFEAQYIIAWNYCCGVNVDVDMKRARFWLNKMQRDGNEKEYDSLKTLIDKPDNRSEYVLANTERRAVEAYNRLLAHANSVEPEEWSEEHAQTLFELGSCLYFGFGCEEDEEGAYEYLLAAHELDYEPAEDFFYFEEWYF